MIQNYARDAIVESLLNSLEVERHVRGPLLMCVVDELAASQELSPAMDAARSLLAWVQDGFAIEGEFAARLVELRLLVRTLSSGAADAA